jgi:serine protease Do
MKDIKTEINKKEEKEKVIRREKKSFLSKNNVILIATIFITIIIGIFIGGSSMYLYIINSDFLNLSEEEVEDNDPVLTTEEESTIIDVVDAVEESVVSIAVTEVSFSPSNGVVDETASIGSGFIADESGLIVTNQHVVSDEDSDYKVITSDGTEYDVVSITRDDVNDIAVLKIDAENLKPVELGDSDSLVVGQTVIAIGTPLGEYAGTVTTGVISGLNRSVTTSSSWYGDSSKDYENVIQTDAAVNSGNSGGPLLNTSGQVVGINFATTSNADNISFALPINIVRQDWMSILHMANS